MVYITESCYDGEKGVSPSRCFHVLSPSFGSDSPQYLPPLERYGRFESRIVRLQEWVNVRD